MKPNLMKPPTKTTDFQTHQVEIILNIQRESKLKIKERGETKMIFAVTLLLLKPGVTQRYGSIKIPKS